MCRAFKSSRDVEFVMPIIESRTVVGVAHQTHHHLEFAGLAKNAASVVVPGTVENEIGPQTRRVPCPPSTGSPLPTRPVCRCTATVTPPCVRPAQREWRISRRRRSMEQISRPILCCCPEERSSAHQMRCFPRACNATPLCCACLHPSSRR